MHGTVTARGAATCHIRRSPYPACACRQVQVPRNSRQRGPTQSLTDRSWGPVRGPAAPRATIVWARRCICPLQHSCPAAAWSAPWRCRRLQMRVWSSNAPLERASQRVLTLHRPGSCSLRPRLVSAAFGVLHTGGSCSAAEHEPHSRPPGHPGVCPASAACSDWRRRVASRAVSHQHLAVSHHAMPVAPAWVEWVSLCQVVGGRNGGVLDGCFTQQRLLN
jgi:hypothetical protein